MIHRIYFFIKFLCLPLGLALAVVPALPVHWIVKALAGIAGIPLLLAGALAFYNIFLSANRSRVSRTLNMDVHSVTHDNMHNSFTDLILFKGRFVLAHAVSPYHLGNAKSRIVVKVSHNARDWTEIKSFDMGEDIRDPKLAVIGGRLFLYVLMNREVQPRPYTTRFSCTGDLVNWTDLEGVGHEGWLFWRPKSLDGRVWYCPAYWHRFGRTALFSSTDGIHWDYKAKICSGKVVNESCFEFDPEGNILVAGRAEYSKKLFPDRLFGNESGSTIISRSEPPYERFTMCHESARTRLDGPVLFKAGERIFAAGRSQPAHDRIFRKTGSIFAKKRTSLYELSDNGLRWITDFPSAGDTSYCGAVVKDGRVFVSYYTSSLKHDYIWVFGMIEPTQVMVAEFEIP